MCKSPVCGCQSCVVFCDEGWVGFKNLMIFGDSVSPVFYYKIRFDWQNKKFDNSINFMTFFVSIFVIDSSSPGEIFTQS